MAMMILKQVLVFLLSLSFVEAEIKGRYVRRRTKKGSGGGRGKNSGWGNNNGKYNTGGNNNYYGNNNGNNGGWTGGYNYGQRAPAFQLEEAQRVPCISFVDSRQYISARYPGDAQCTTEYGITSSGACCRVFEFEDRWGPQKSLLYDAYNGYASFPCVCNQNTKLYPATSPPSSETNNGFSNGAIADSSSGSFSNGDSSSSTSSGNDDSSSSSSNGDSSSASNENVDWGGDSDSYQDGAVFEDGVIFVDYSAPPPPTTTTVPTTVPTIAPGRATQPSPLQKHKPTPSPTPAPTGNGVCASQNLSSNQQFLQSTTFLTSCETSSDCRSTACCYRAYCVCWGLSFLPGGSDNPGCLA